MLKEKEIGKERWLFMCYTASTCLTLMHARKAGRVSYQVGRDSAVWVVMHSCLWRFSLHAWPAVACEAVEELWEDHAYHVVINTGPYHIAVCMSPQITVIHTAEY